MRTIYKLTAGLAAVVGALTALLVIFRLVSGPTNFLLPGFGLVISLEFVILCFLLLGILLAVIALIFRKMSMT